MSVSRYFAPLATTAVVTAATASAETVRRRRNVRHQNFRRHQLITVLVITFRVYASALAGSRSRRQPTYVLVSASCTRSSAPCLLIAKSANSPVSRPVAICSPLPSGAGRHLCPPHEMARPNDWLTA
ncbi:MAG: hypothetical protein QOG10_259 [Kribbellaceae bacterium]|nr:hypothetical protein [Kribbellaceae bacterium]